MLFKELSQPALEPEDAAPPSWPFFAPMHDALMTMPPSVLPLAVPEEMEGGTAGVAAGTLDEAFQEGQTMEEMEEEFEDDEEEDDEEDEEDEEEEDDEEEDEDDGMMDEEENIGGESLEEDSQDMNVCSMDDMCHGVDPLDVDEVCKFLAGCFVFLYHIPPSDFPDFLGLSIFPILFLPSPLQEFLIILN